jgi:hypothetical protein
LSTTFQIAADQPVVRSLIEPGLADLRWYGDEPPDPLAAGSWSLFRTGISTRITTVAYDPGRVAVTLRSGACVEDCELALGVVRRVAEDDGRSVDCGEFGTVRLDELADVFDDAWMRRQPDSAARIATHLARERGMIAMPGPTRKVWIGPRVIGELEDGDPEAAGERLIAIMRRVLWPDARYEPASEFRGTSRDGQEFTLAILIPNRPCVLPHSDQLAIEDTHDVIVIPRRALAKLPVEITWLDDGNQLIEGIDTDQWPAVCQAARAHQHSG